MGHRLFKAPNGVRRLGEIRHGNCGRFLFLLPTFGETMIVSVQVNGKTVGSMEVSENSTMYQVANQVRASFGPVRVIRGCGVVNVTRG